MRRPRTKRYGDFLRTRRCDYATMTAPTLGDSHVLAQKGNRAKRELQSVVHNPGETSVRHALEAFDAFVDGVVEEIGQLKATLNDGSEAAGTKDSTESIVPANASPDVAQLENERKELAQPH